ncbi:MAG: ATP-binding cassette domain-containing protein [Alphaproteobacteria bacterium]|nr:ATP-binding cassette domain-containing protein [Alphaproteobacteria bacterium]
MLEINNLNVTLSDRQLLKNISFKIDSGARVLLSGHNGSGKSTLANVIAGNPLYTIESGNIKFNDTDITNENATTRALMGIFLGSQHVPEIPGLSIINFLKHSCIAHTHFQSGHDLSMGEFLEKLASARTQLNIPEQWMNRSVNVGFSGGERKKIMLLQLIMTQPKFAILDEPDSGADSQTQQLIADTIKTMSNTTFLFISHQQSFTDMISPTDTITLSDGQIVIQ